VPEQLVRAVDQVDVQCVVPSEVSRPVYRLWQGRCKCFDLAVEDFERDVVVDAHEKRA